MKNSLIKYFQLFKSSHYLKVTAIVLLILAIPITVLIAQQQQEIRQRASEPVTSPYPTTEIGFTPDSLQIAPTQFAVTNLWLHTPESITGVNLMITFTPLFADIISFTPSTAFDSVVKNTIVRVSSTFGALYITLVNTNGLPPTGNIQLGTLSVKGISSGTSTINIGNQQLTALGKTDAVTNVTKYYTKVVVALPTNTPTPNPTNTPTPVPPTATPTSTPTPVILTGDINADGFIDILDFNTWRDEFIGIRTTKLSDLNHDATIDLLDFNIWRNAFNPSPTGSQ
ncbi:MAG: hypothetical protein HYT10_03190 [Candidatus Levybacteria bacterium]|nr:hypothetical protein [Candidatus Levybacteria bacterium]